MPTAPPTRHESTRHLSTGLALAGCQAQRAADPEPTETAPAIATTTNDAEPSAPEAALKPPTLSQHGEALLGVQRAEIRSATMDVSGNELVVMFDFPMVRGKRTMQGFPVIEPSKLIDYNSVADRLGARRTGDVPKEFMMMCGENHGGDFETDGLKFGVYVSGGCHHVRIFDVTPEAVTLLLGRDFLSLLDSCSTIELGPACRTADRVRIGVNQSPRGGRSPRGACYSVV